MSDHAQTNIKNIGHTPKTTLSQFPSQPDFEPKSRVCVMAAQIKAEIEIECRDRVLTYLELQQNEAGVPSWLPCLQNKAHSHNNKNRIRSAQTRALISLDPNNDACDRCVIVPFEWAQRMARIEAEAEAQDMLTENSENPSSQPSPSTPTPTPAPAAETAKRGRGRQPKACGHGGKRQNQLGAPKKQAACITEDAGTRPGLGNCYARPTQRHAHTTGA